MRKTIARPTLAAMAAMALGVTAFLGCQGGEIQGPANEAPAAPAGQRVLSEIKVGDGSVTFYANGEVLSFLERRKPGAAPIVGKDMEGLTLAQIFQRLAPGQKVPPELAASLETYSPASARSQQSGAPEGDHLSRPNPVQPVPPALAKAADYGDAWFRDNYCNYFNNWDGYKACMLNQSGGTSWWAWANATQSQVYVYPHTGTYIHLNGKVDGSGIFDADLLAGSVYRYYMFSGRHWYQFGLGCRAIQQHYYTITHTAGQMWHWALGSLTGC